MTVTLRLPQAGHNKVRRSCANQRVEVELPAIMAFPDPLHAVTLIMGAPHVHLPSKASRYPQCLDFYGNESGKLARFVTPSVPLLPEMWPGIRVISSQVRSMRRCPALCQPSLNEEPSTRSTHVGIQ